MEIMHPIIKIKIMPTTIAPPMVPPIMAEMVTAVEKKVYMVAHEFKFAYTISCIGDKGCNDGTHVHC